MSSSPTDLGVTHRCIFSANQLTADTPVKLVANNACLHCGRLVSQHVSDSLLPRVSRTGLLEQAPDPSKKRALITGITGQDGSFLAELLINKGYEVHGIIRPSSTFNTSRIEHIFGSLKLHYGDMTDARSLARVVHSSQPHEVYNLAAQSHVARSFMMPEYTDHVDYIGVRDLLAALETAQLLHSVRFYQASTSELYGAVEKREKQNELTPFHPQSPYAMSKRLAFMKVVEYREKGMFAVNGILFNHESERRGETFVTRKVTRYVGRYMCGLESQPLLLGNMEASRDWGYAPDYVEGMWMMLQQEKPDDFVLATGKTVSVRDMVRSAFKAGGLDLVFRGEGVNEKGVIVDSRGTEHVVVSVDPAYYRPREVEFLLGSAKKAKRVLGWRPKTKFDDLIRIMVEHDFNAARRLRGRVPLPLPSYVALDNVVLVLGGSGLVGHGMQISEPPGYKVVYAGSADADLTDPHATMALFRKVRPAYVILLAARVGGLFANQSRPFEFGVDNLLIAASVTNACRHYRVKKLVSLLSTCIFPDAICSSGTPIRADQLHDGPPHPSNAPYAHAKRELDILSRALTRQFGIPAVTVVPTNVYGPHDNFKHGEAHVLPALIRRFAEAKAATDAGRPTKVTLKGTGVATRQFVHSGDLGRALWWSLQHYESSEPIVIAPSTVVSIAEIAQILKEVSGGVEYDFEGVAADDGQLTKTADGSPFERAQAERPASERIVYRPLREGIADAYAWFVENQSSARL